MNPNSDPESPVNIFGSEYIAPVHGRSHQPMEVDP
ncbi:unnamed protein product, partial [Allacma fusca]